jgi:hypothetical protein
MKKRFSYSILQYKHSLLLNEALNVGILFSFPDDSVVHFEVGNLTRLRAAYPSFDTTNVTKAITRIKTRIHSEYTGLFHPFNAFGNDDRFRNHILRQDDTSLQFTDFRKSTYPFDDFQKIIDEYSKLLLPKYGSLYRIRHDEKYILKTYTKLIQETLRDVNIALTKNVQVESKGIKLKFDVAWKNGTTNLVKPVSFDLIDQTDIQNKSMQYFGYLTNLNDYAKKHNISYHLIVGKPQRTELYQEYAKAIDIMRSADSPKRIIGEEDLTSYSKETANYLAEHIKRELGDTP